MGVRKKITKLIRGTIPREKFSDFRINPVVTRMRGSCGAILSTLWGMTAVAASYESSIHERVADEDLDSGFCSVPTPPVDSPLALEKPENSSKTETELKINIIPLKQFVGSLIKEQDKISQNSK